MTTPAAPPPFDDDSRASGSPAYGPPPGWEAQPPPGYGAPAGYGSGPQQGQQEETVWAVLAHLSFFVIALIGPLVIYLVKRNDSPFSRAHAAEALNFHITLTIAMIVAVPLVFVLIGIPLLFAILVGGAVYSVLAAVAAGSGKPYRYPLTWRPVS